MPSFLLASKAGLFQFLSHSIDSNEGDLSPHASQAIYFSSINDNKISDRETPVKFFSLEPQYGTEPLLISSISIIRHSEASSCCSPLYWKVWTLKCVERVETVLHAGTVSSLIFSNDLIHYNIWYFPLKCTQLRYDFIVVLWQVSCGLLKW